MSDKKITNFLFEVGTLKNMPRTGWLKAGIKSPESVAEHTMRTALLGWILAGREGANSDKVVKMCLLHDLAESRIGDFDKVMKKYFDKNRAELSAESEIIENLPEKTKVESASLYKEWHKVNTKEAIVARDADRLEMFIQAHEYENMGHSKKTLKEWKDSVRTSLKTKSAKEILKLVEKSSFEDWWQFVYQK